MEWKHGEAGPVCFCGLPTVVSLKDEFGNVSVNLVCLFHTASAGAIFPLPKEKPANWPSMTDTEMHALIDQAYIERDGQVPTNIDDNGFVIKKTKTYDKNLN